MEAFDRGAIFGSIDPAIANMKLEVRKILVRLDGRNGVECGSNI